jgi:hypothetical protein
MVLSSIVRITSVSGLKELPPRFAIVIVSSSTVPIKWTDGGFGEDVYEKTTKYKIEKSTIVIPNNNTTSRTSDTAWFERLFFVIASPFFVRKSI